MRARTAGGGFTLVELIVVIAIAAVLAILAALILRGPIAGYFAQVNRGTLVDLAQQALTEMAQDIRAALPNSVRVASSGGGTALELIPVLDGGRYRDGPSPCAGGGCPQPMTYYRLQFNVADTDFNLLAPFQTVTAAPAGARLVIYNLGQPGADAYAGDPVITPAGTAITLSPNNDLALSNGGAGVAEQHVHLNPGFKFAFRSPNKRIYLVSQPVSYLCAGTGTANGNGTGTLTRYWNYGFVNPQPVPPPTPPGSAQALVVDHVSACAFTYQAGTSQRNGLATLSLSVTRNGESVNLVEQVHVDNVP